jgi:hypothetical protein
LDLSSQKLEPKSRLIFIRVIQAFHDDEMAENSLINHNSLVQLILDASPSLTKLHLFVPNIYPDFHCIPSLTRSKNLKYLTWIGQPWTRNTTLEDSTFDIKKLCSLQTCNNTRVKRCDTVWHVRFWNKTCSCRVVWKNS